LDLYATDQNGPARSVRCLPFLLLALMVFVWGTGYKLSLYKPASKNGTAPAKLCTRDSDAARSAVLDATEGHRAITLVVVLTPLIAPATVSLDTHSRSVEDGQALNPSPFRPPAALDLRPPPRRPLELG
jgi:hypothetical protein